MRYLLALALVAVALVGPARGQCPGGVCPAPNRQFAPQQYYQPEPGYYAAPIPGVREFRSPMVETYGAIPYVIFCPCVAAPVAPAPVSVGSYYVPPGGYYNPAPAARGHVAIRYRTR